jgi:hypothetical protein
MLVGCGLTLGALLHSIEWYGGGAPPARYLVPMLPAFALSTAMVLRRPLRWRRLSVVLIPPSLLAWWVLITRPHFSVNPGDGGYWLSDALARRFAADARFFFPSFLVPNTATVVVPLALLVAALLAVCSAVWRPVLARVLRRSWVGLWLVAAAALVLSLDLRHDEVVEFEAPQVRRSGGSPVPPAGTVSRFRHRRGWRLDAGDGLYGFPTGNREGATLVRPRTAPSRFGDVEADGLGRPVRLVPQLAIPDLGFPNRRQQLQRHAVDAQPMMRKQRGGGGS